MNHYEAAREKYRLAGVDTEAVIEKMMKIPVSLHCWQGDDVKGFDQEEFRLQETIRERRELLRS